jgi:hypothetical protein
VTLIVGAAFTCVLFVASFAVALRKLTAAASASATEEDWQWIPFQAVSIERYLPMERLLSERDFRYLEACGRFGKKRLHRLRLERRQAFRTYVAYLTLDYARIAAAIKLLIVNSPEDRPDLAGVLARQRLLFTAALARTEFLLALHALGIGNPSGCHLMEALQQTSSILNGLSVQARKNGSIAAA